MAGGPFDDLRMGKETKKTIVNFPCFHGGILP